MNVVFDGKNYSLTHLFKDQQRQILNGLLESTWEEIESSFRHIYEHNYAIMQMIRNMNMPSAQGAVGAGGVHSERGHLCGDSGRRDRSDRLRDLADEVGAAVAEPRQGETELRGQPQDQQPGELWEDTPEDFDLLWSIEKGVEILRMLTPEMDLQHAQNVFFTIAKRKYPEMKQKAAVGDEKAAEWVEHFGHLAQRLGLAIP